MARRDIAVEEVKEAILTGEIIEGYPELVQLELGSAADLAGGQ
jgi:hypothetical protein